MPSPKNLITKNVPSTTGQFDHAFIDLFTATTSIPSTGILSHPADLKCTDPPVPPPWACS